ncbi:MAG: ATP phosphoribosyltransferase regulatory subunit [Clostridia bacterium]|nr:ATP phosphoribosyltransferase regulatory subunit [Clostridia bacterium]
MSGNLSFLYNDELTVLKLRKLYEDRGFKKFRMSKFESYDFYARNKDFLVGNRIITFTDLNGKLMALKPDVTLSIVKNADNTADRQKLYYTENVYRESKDIHEFKEISQVGLEVLGDIDLFQTVEIITLAVKSLLELDENAILEISHMGYTEGLLDCLTNDTHLRAELHKLFKEKNAHDLIKLAESNSLPKSPVNTAVDVMSCKSSNDETIENALSNALNNRMQEAVKEVSAIFSLLKKTDLDKHIRIDFSVTDDPGYYNGILMHGYVHSIPRDVLSGGRYDSLMSKMGKDKTQAMGFAIYFDALDRKLHVRNKIGTDVIVVYNENSDINILADFCNKLSADGISYNAVTKIPENICNSKVYSVDGTDVKEVTL